MRLTCPLLLLFVLKLEDHLSQKIEILYRAWAQKVSEYILFLLLLFSSPLLSLSLSPPPLPHTHPEKVFFSSDMDSLSEFTY